MKLWVMKLGSILSIKLQSRYVTQYRGSTLTGDIKNLCDVLCLARDSIYSYALQWLCFVVLLHVDDQSVFQHGLFKVENGQKQNLPAKDFALEMPCDVAGGFTFHIAGVHDNFSNCHWRLSHNLHEFRPLWRNANTWPIQFIQPHKMVIIQITSSDLLWLLYYSIRTDKNFKQGFPWDVSIWTPYLYLHFKMSIKRIISLFELQ